MQRLDQYLLPFSGAVDQAAAYQGEYHDGLVLTSLLIASLSAFVALSVSGRIVAATSERGRLAWAVAGAVSMGGGIWGMHFIGMLSLTLPCGVSYDPLGTILSLLPGIIASGAALSIIGRSTVPTMGRLAGGALLMGGGIGAMHYAGMASMRPEALLLYDIDMVIVSVVVAVLLAFLSLSIHFHLRQIMDRIPATLVAALMMGLAVSGMHYTAMYAATFYADPSASLQGPQLPPTLLAMLVAVLTVLVASITLAATYAARQIDLVSRLSSEVQQRVAVERDVQRTNARTQAIVDAVADAIVTIDRNGRIRQWSRGAERIFGYSADEVMGGDITVLMPAPHRIQHDTYVSSFLHTREAKIIGMGRELTAIRKDGSEFPIELTVSEVRGIDEILFTGIMRDITDRKRAEQELIDARKQAEAASRAKSDFVATMSHEIRTPMNGVLGMAHLLVATKLNEHQTRLVENLMRSGQALMGLINDILDFSKIEAGRLDLAHADFDPREMIAGVADLFSERCARKGLELVYYVQEDVPGLLRGDQQRLRQICINLIGNAIKFTEKGEVLVEVGLAEDFGEQVMLDVVVADTGIGIPAEKRASVFESFYQIDSSMSRARGGSGLGLAIVKRLVELMGGQVGVDSEVGRGSRFWFTVRVDKAEGAAPRGPRHLPRELSVVLLEANAVSARVTTTYLRHWGIPTTAHTTPADALAAIQRSGADVAILDIGDYGSAALGLAAELKRGAKPVHVILVTATDANTIADDHGAFATLAKPIRPSELFDCLVEIAAGTVHRRKPRELAQTRNIRLNARILVAEDNAINQDVVVGMLENLGCRVVTAPNGRAAVEACAREEFDLILMDCEMPEMDGFEAARRIRESERLANWVPGNQSQPKHIPIIAVTSHALAEMRDRCLQSGMDDFVTKPFDDLQLVTALQRYLSGRATAQEASAADRKAAGQARPDAAPVEPIDLDTIRQIKIIEARGTSGLLKRVIAKFAAQAPTMFEDIRAKHAAGDAEALWRAAHALKSSASAVGAKQVWHRCGEIELQARAAGVADVSPMIQALDGELKVALRSLQSWDGDADAAAR